jgi:hypothetical protein
VRRHCGEGADVGEKDAHIRPGLIAQDHLGDLFPFQVLQELRGDEFAVHFVGGIQFCCQGDGAIIMSMISESPADRPIAEKGK